MLKKEFELKKVVKVDEIFQDLAQLTIAHDLVTKLNQVHLLGTFTYHDSIKTLDVNASIEVDFNAIDARTGKEEKNNVQKINWSEAYCFSEDNVSGDDNIVYGEDFDILAYAIDEIVLNIPINFTKNYDRISIVNEYGVVSDEATYETITENDADPRWEKLKEFKFKQ